MGDDGADPARRPSERGGESERRAWYEDADADPRPWEAALRETDSPSITEYLRAAREEGATTRALVLVGAVLLLLVVVPAALVAGIVTVFAFSLVEHPLLVWAGLTAVVLALLVAWLETR
jgi:hypothetical protein